MWSGPVLETSGIGVPRVSEAAMLIPITAPLQSLSRPSMLARTRAYAVVDGETVNRCIVAVTVAIMDELKSPSVMLIWMS